LKATPKDDDTFLYDEKGCLFLLTADLPACLLHGLFPLARQIMNDREYRQHLVYRLA
jgi:hypothetical protein